MRAGDTPAARSATSSATAAVAARFGVLRPLPRLPALGERREQVEPPGELLVARLHGKRSVTAGRLLAVGVGAPGRGRRGASIEPALRGEPERRDEIESSHTVSARVAHGRRAGEARVALGDSTHRHDARRRRTGVTA